MQLITLLLSLCVSISLSLAQEAELKTETITMLDASGSTLIATITTPVQDQATQNPTTQPRQRAEQSTFATTTSAPTAAAATSVVQATRTEAYTPASSSSTTNENGIDVEAGASGSASGGFSLSKGGMIAIIVVVVVVAVFGVLSITLFIVAKRRQWKVRESIKRASRRLTGRTVPKSEAQRRKRSGVVAGATRGQRAPPSTPLVSRKEGSVSETELKDVEKGESTEPNGWVSRMGRNDWK